MADKKITPKAASAKDKQEGDRAAARVSLKRSAKLSRRVSQKKVARKQA